MSKIKNHTCKKSTMCTCSSLGLEPDESCPVHGAGEFPPRCEICGKYMPYKEETAEQMYKDLFNLIHIYIDQEPECPGPMPDEMWESIRNDKDAMENAIKIAVKLTKKGIHERIRACLER